MTVNKWIGVGRLGRDPESRQTTSGAAVTNMNIATDDSYTDRDGQRQDRTEWHRVVCFGKTAEHCARYLSKGRQVYIEGRLQTREWQDKDGNKRFTTEIVAQVVQFLDGKSSGDGDRNRESPPKHGRFDPGPSRSGPDYQGEYEDQDVPF